jgi:phosphotransferase system HPr (HPr) family protein
MLTQELRLVNQTGLHIRPASMLVKTASRFRAAVRVARLQPHRSEAADAKSILRVLALGATGGTPLSLQAEGADAEAALSALADCVANLSD